MIELSEFVHQFRRELYRSMLAAKDEPLRLELGAIELEVELATTRENAASGKLRFWVVDAGADVKVASSSVQRVKLTLSPRFPSSSVQPWINDEAELDEQ